jgi:hypothetical protein
MLYVLGVFRMAKNASNGGVSGVREGTAVSSGACSACSIKGCIRIPAVGKAECYSAMQELSRALRLGSEGEYGYRSVEQKIGE